MQQQGTEIMESNYIVIADDHSVLLAITDIILAAKAKLCYAERLPQIALLLEEVPRQTVIIDLAPWGADLAKALSDHIRRKGHNSCICIISQEQEQEIRGQNWSSNLYLVAKDNLDKELPAAFRKCADARRMRDQAENILLLQKQSLYNTLSKEAEQMKLEDKGIFKREITRRKFLKGAAAAAAVAGVAMSGGTNLLSPVAQAAGEAESVEKVFQGGCRGNCGGSCAMNVHVRGGKVVKTSKIDSPDPLETRLCAKGLSHAQHIYSSDRVKYPLRRIGERGAGEWEQITWDEAIEHITDKWKEIIEEDGPESIAHMFGSGTYAADWMYHRRVFNNLGATEISPPYDTAGLQIMAIMVGRGPMLHGNGKRDILNSKYIFVWGKNAPGSGYPRWTYNLAALDNGAKMVTINPNYNLAARHSDVFVPLRPGTDGILAMAMVNVVVEEGLQDDEFMRNGTVAPFLVKKSDGKFLRISDTRELEEGEVDAIVVRASDGTIGLPGEISEPVLNGSYTIGGQEVDTAYKLMIERVAEWTPQRAAEYCDIPVETIYQIARMYAEGPSHIDFGFGFDHWTRGAAPYQCIAVLAFVTGQFGRSGAGFGGVLGGDGTAMMMNWSALFAQPGHTAGPSIASNNIPGVMEEGKYGDRDLKFRSLFSYAGNPISTHPGRKKMIEYFNQMDLVVAADSMMTDTCRYADIVLPVPHWFEVDTFVAMVSEYVRINEKAVEPLYESKSDIEIGNLIGSAMGLDDILMTNDEYHTTMLATASAMAFDLSWEALKQQKWMRHIPENFIYGENYAPLLTETGRCPIYLENPTPNYLAGPGFDKRKMALPHWDPPVEAWFENPAIEEYPLTLMSRRHRFKTHTTFTKGMPWLLELMPEPVVMLNPAAADARGIKDDDYVRIFNDRGHVVMKAAINPGIRPDVIEAEHTWEESQYIDGHYHDLMEIRTDDWITAVTFYDTLCQVERIDEAEVKRLKAAKMAVNQIEQEKLSELEGGM